LSKQNSKNQNNESNKIHQNVKWCKNHEKKEENRTVLSKNCLVSSKTVQFSRNPLPSLAVFMSFLLSVFLVENGSVLLNTVVPFLENRSLSQSLHVQQIGARQ
jgi:Ni,Fe-hydrogenase I cytochrome b subunit